MLLSQKMLLTATMLSVFFFGAMGAASIAFAQYVGNIDTERVYAPDEVLETLPYRVDIAENNPLKSGLPTDANDVVNMSVIIGAVFGGIAGVFILNGRSGKYAAMGRR